MNRHEISKLSIDQLFGLKIEIRIGKSNFNKDVINMINYEWDYRVLESRVHFFKYYMPLNIIRSRLRSLQNKLGLDHPRVVIKTRVVKQYQKKYKTQLKKSDLYYWIYAAKETNE